MKLSPSQDTKINKFRLDEEAANISYLLNQYDEKWNEATLRLEKLNAKVDNCNDELKNLKLELSFKAKTAWSGILELGGKQPSDKVAESWAVSQDEYKSKLDELKELREERAEALSTEQLFRNYHFQLIQKGHSIETLTKQWAAQYFSTDISGGEKNVKVSRELTETVQKRTLTRKGK